MISVKNLSFSYGNREVLHDITFDAKQGEMLCVLGHNGAGKSTLFKCMLGLLRGYGGTVTIDGKDMAGMNPAEKATHVAYIPQAANPAFSYSVIDMVLMGTNPRLSGRVSPGAAEREIALDTLEKTGIESLANRSYSMISGGEQQLVIIARALAQGAETLILDEPTSSLDYGNQMRVQKILRKLIEEGYTIIQSSHNPEQAYTFSDRIICIKEGRIFREGAPVDIMDERLIEDLYGIEVEMMTSSDKRARFFALKEDGQK